MASIARHGARYVVPFSKSGAPPFVVLRDWMKLRQIEREELGQFRSSSGRRRQFFKQRPAHAIPLQLAIGLETAVVRPAADLIPAELQPDIHEFLESINVAIVVEVSRPDKFGVETGRALAALADAPVKPMLESIYIRLAHVGIVVEIKRDIEIGVGRTAISTSV